MNISVIIAAAGLSRRMGQESNKVLTPLAGEPALAYSLDLFQADPQVKEIIVAARPADMAQIRHICLACPKGRVVAGGPSRGQSVAAALAQTSPQADYIAVHDGARPLLHPSDWQRLLAALEHSEAAILAAPLADSVKQVRHGIVAASLEREQLMAAQTPQIFRASLLRQAYALAAAEGREATDDAALAEALGAAITVVTAQEANFKLTCPEDQQRAQLILAQRQGNAGGKPPALRVGLGWDSHALAAGRPLILGGAEIPHHLGLVGHSDADVLLHAVIDALFGAAGRADIGCHFPDHDPAWQGADSRRMLALALAEVHDLGWQLINLDGVITAAQPRLAPFLPQLRRNLAAMLQIEAEAVNLKAKTPEGLGPTADSLIQAQVVLLLWQP